MDAKREFKGPGPLEKAWLWMEAIFNGAAAAPHNPFNYLGAVCILFMWIILATGFYIFIFYSISAKEAYPSVEAITHGQWYAGGIMRSLHRYASDGLVIAMALHGLKCWVLDRYKHWRKVAWVSGVIIAWVVIAGGVFGYWMVWDERAKIIAELSSRLFEAVPIFGLPLSLNFARVENLTNQLFYIILFVHFSTSVVLFLLIMIHISRITKSIVTPPKVVIYALAIALLILSIIKPAVSGAPADLKALTQEVPFDWFYLFIFPLLKYLSAREVWAAIIALTAVVIVVPWLTWGRGARRNPSATVTVENCVGCELCQEDCPYQAIQMRKRTDGAPYELTAVVTANRCASCGICAGACDYNAINLPDMTEADVKENIRKASMSAKAGSVKGVSTVVFLCAKSVNLESDIEGNRIKGFDNAVAVTLPCIGMLQPSMLSIPFEEGIDGVFVSACSPGDCQYRTGDIWFGQRLTGLRPPIVKKSIDRARVKAVYLSSVEKAGFRQGLADFLSSLTKREG